MGQKLPGSHQTPQPNQHTFITGSNVNRFVDVLEVDIDVLEDRETAGQDVEPPEMKALLDMVDGGASEMDLVSMIILEVVVVPL